MTQMNSNSVLRNEEGLLQDAQDPWYELISPIQISSSEPQIICDTKEPKSSCQPQKLNNHSNLDIPMNDANEILSVITDNSGNVTEVTDEEDDHEAQV